MRNFQAPLNLNVCKVMTEKYWCWGFSLNKVSGWSCSTIFKWDSGFGPFFWILLSFTKHLFADHLQKAASVVFCQVSLFPVWTVAIQFFFIIEIFISIFIKKIQHKCYNQKTYKSFLFNKHKIKHLKVKIKAKKKQQKTIIKLKIKNEIKKIIIILMKKII